MKAANHGKAKKADRINKNQQFLPGEISRRAGTVFGVLGSVDLNTA